MFAYICCRRQADRTVQLWLQRLKESPSPKRLNLLYLANGAWFCWLIQSSPTGDGYPLCLSTAADKVTEVAQQSKARKKEDFVLAFSPVIAEATAAAYKGAPSEVQSKIRRVIDVWKDRSIFEGPIQEAVETRINGMCTLSCASLSNH